MTCCPLATPAVRRALLVLRVSSRSLGCYYAGVGSVGARLRSRRAEEGPLGSQRGGLSGEDAEGGNDEGGTTTPGLNDRRKPHAHSLLSLQPMVRPLPPSVAPAQQLTLRAAIDRWFEDLQHYEATLEEMAAASLDANFKEELSAIEQWFRVLSEAERTAALYSLLQSSTQVQIDRKSVV